MTITRTFEVIDGQTIPDVSGLDATAALARKRELERLLAATRGDPARVSERDRLRAEDTAVSKRLADLKEATKVENQRRSQICGDHHDGPAAYVAKKAKR